jgi:hypothetical protein
MALLIHTNCFLIQTPEHSTCTNMGMWLRAALNQWPMGVMDTHHRDLTPQVRWIWDMVFIFCQMSSVGFETQWAIFFFVVVLEFEFRASLLLGRHSTTWATPFLCRVFLRQNLKNY